jgi:hypothetical protein
VTSWNFLAISVTCLCDVYFFRYIAIVVPTKDASKESSFQYPVINAIKTSVYVIDMNLIMTVLDLKAVGEVHQKLRKCISINPIIAILDCQHILELFFKYFPIHTLVFEKMFLRKPKSKFKMSALVGTFRCYLT